MSVYRTIGPTLVYVLCFTRPRYQVSVYRTIGPLVDFNLPIHNDTVSTKIYNKRDDFDIVNFLLLDGDVPRRPS